MKTKKEKFQTIKDLVVDKQLIKDRICRDVYKYSEICDNHKINIPIYDFVDKHMGDFKCYSFSYKLVLDSRVMSLKDRRNFIRFCLKHAILCKLQWRNIPKLFSWFYLRSNFNGVVDIIKDLFNIKHGTYYTYSRITSFMVRQDEYLRKYMGDRYVPVIGWENVEVFFIEKLKTYFR